MASDTISTGSARTPRAWTLAAVALACAVAAGGVLAWWLWPRRPDRDPMRLALLRTAFDEFNAGRYPRAEAILARREADGVVTPLDWMLRARVAEAQGRIPDALGYLQRIPDTSPVAAQAWMKAGQIERARNRLRAAEAAFLHALALNPDQIQSHRELAYIYVLQRRRADGNAQFRELARLIAFDYKLAFSWSQNDCDTFDPDEAMRLLIPVVAADPEDRWSRLALAHDCRVIGRYDLVEATLRPLGDSDPDARAIRARMALDRGDLDAVAELLRGGPADHPRLNELRGRMALQRGEPDRAAECFRAALRRDPGDRDATHGLGTAMGGLHDPRCKALLETTGLLDELKRLIIGCANVHKIDAKTFPRLGEICEALGRTDQARVWYQVALAWEPLDTRSRQGLARLDGASR